MKLSVSRLFLAPIGAVCAAAILAVGSPLHAAGAVPPVPLEAYGKLPNVEVTAISPSGDRIAFVGTLQGTRVLIAIEDQTKTLTAVRVGDMKVRSLRWIGEDRLMLTSSQTEDLSSRFTTDKAEFLIARIIPITPGEEGGVVFGNSRKHPDTIQGTYGIRKVGDRHYGFFGGIELDRGRTGSRTSTRLDHTRPHLFRVDLENFKIKKVANAAPINTGSDWLIDAKGELAYSMQVDYTTGAWWVRNAKGDRVLDGVQPGGSVGLIGLGYGGKTAIVRWRTDTGSKWVEIDQAGGEPKPFLKGVDFERLFFDPATGHLMGYTEGEGDKERHVFADKSLQTKAERVRKAFQSSETSFAGWTSDLSDVIIRTSGNGDSGTYFAVDLGTSRANAIAYERDSIAAGQVGAISTFAYTASDGMELDGILTLPPGREAKNLPIVMLPHGGPHSSDSPEFDWWAQAFASRGYAVFQPNFRGSTNRDAAFTRAGYGEWGRRMQLDKSDGLKALADMGIVDPDRACIVGASYGGYAALAAVTIQQGLYKCSVAVAPVSDLANMYREDYQASGKDRTMKVSLLEQLGDPDLWDEVSPLRRADEADAPIMLIHGKDDTVVPYSHSTRMADKLKDAKKLHELVTLEGEDHWLSLSTTRQQMLQNAVRWVEKHNPAD